MAFVQFNILVMKLYCGKHNALYQMRILTKIMCYMLLVTVKIPYWPLIGVAIIGLIGDCLIVMGGWVVGSG